MKYILTKKDINTIVKMYNDGLSQMDISEKTRYNLRTVGRVIKDNTGHYTDIKPREIKKKHKKTSMEIKKEKIIELYKAGYTVEQIDEKYDMSVGFIESILIGEKLMKPDISGLGKNIITVNILNEFRDTYVNIGDIFSIRNTYIRGLNDSKEHIPRFINVKILKKYPNIVCTDKGSFQYIELYNGKKIK